MSNDNDTVRDLKVAEWRRITMSRAIHAVCAASGMHHSSSGGKSQGTKAMSQDMIKQNAEVENIQTAAQADSGFEKIAKFKKGHFSVDEEEIPLGTEYIAHARAWAKCWIKFVDGEVKERKMYRVALGEKPPEREELGDQDESNWSDGLDGKPADPWVYQYLLPLENPANGDVIVFVTSSFGGRRAIADLCSAYVRRAAKAANCGQPIIKLGVTDMPTKKFGKVPRPLFEVDRWDEAGEVEAMPSTTSPSGIPDMNDTIPF
jgi:hypothetical protein